jgi:hypothetical protein
MMTLTRNIIDLHKSSHEDFEYYIIILEKIENNFDKNPDISIESAKSLIEGISKSILLRLDITKTEASVNKMEFPELFKNSCWSIHRHISIEDDFIHRSSTMIQRLAELRNTRGDISHGKASPKKDVSTAATAQMIMHITDAIVNYMLDAFFKIDLSFKEQIVYESNIEFNEELDESFPLPGITYSRALFEQDKILYKEQLIEFTDRKIQEKEDESPKRSRGRK